MSYNDLILVWGPQKRIITGSDLLGRLLRNIATVETRPGAKGGAAAQG
jgi:metal transporter CNNM